MKKLEGWACSVLAASGAVMVGAFFLAWIQDGTSGLSIAWNHDHWLFLAPLSGLLLLATAGTRSPHTRIAAGVAGLVVAGDLTFDMLRGVLHGGLELWLMLGGAICVLAGASAKNRSLRAIGGLAVLAGFIAPWSDDSLFKMLRSEGAEFAAAIGINVKILWLIPVAGVAAIASASSATVKGRNVAIASGIAVFGSILWMIGSFANQIFAWGAWATLGASAVALGLAVLAPVAKASREPQP